MNTPTNHESQTAERLLRFALFIALVFLVDRLKYIRETGPRRQP